MGSLATNELIHGYYREEHSVGEVSQIDGSSVEAVYKMLQRIRRALHKCIEVRMRRAGHVGGGA